MADPLSDPLLRRVFVTASGACLDRGDLCTTAAHILLALLGLTPAARLAAAGIDRAAVEARLERLLAPDRGKNSILMGSKPGCLTPRSRRVLSVAAATAGGAGRGAEVADVWAAVLSDTDSDATRVLAEFGVSGPVPI